jgi:hypothetical protein
MKAYLKRRDYNRKTIFIMIKIIFSYNPWYGTVDLKKKKERFMDLLGFCAPCTKSHGLPSFWTIFSRTFVEWTVLEGGNHVSPRGKGKISYTPKNIFWRTNMACLVHNIKNLGSLFIRFHHCDTTNVSAVIIWSSVCCFMETGF